MFAQVDFQPILYHSLITGRMDNWAATISAMENLYNTNNDKTLLFELTQAQYAYIGYCIGTEKTTEAENYLEKAEQNVQTLLKHNNKWADVYAISGALYGFRVGLNPLMSMVYGPMSIDNINKSLQIDAQSIQGLLEKANAKYYTPAVFGGSRTEALSLYETAVKTMEAKQKTTKSWLYLNALTSYGQAYANTGNKTQARAVYEKILKIEPAYDWVRNDLYPKTK